VLPEAAIEESVATLPGLDGRKMSKSYDNTIPLFAPREQLRKLIMGIVTDSRAPGEAKETEGSALFQIYQAFASAEETAALRQAYADGIAWGDAKQMLFERIEREVAPMRERYEALIAHPDRIEATLIAGADKARQLSAPFMRELRQAVGLRGLNQASQVATARQEKAALPSFKQYREKDGQFYFKLADPKGRVLLQSTGYASPRDAGQAVARLQAEGPTALTGLVGQLAPLPDISSADVEQALRALSDAASN
jgi:tryptophanyl-tRNA synthetase